MLLDDFVGLRSMSVSKINAKQVSRVSSNFQL